ncbi:flagellar assembly protein FliH [Anaerovirgula multivorans]|uniref:Flagellar assembly protein FliH n=1 Tax=Anaerovirgula multivorans TaxID=312168 RepID=A0A239A403_9FIRM|nr:flagellar assembly protein FliH [Anaerovirgula multivorans]
MKSLYKVYKSVEVIVGNKKELQFKGDNILKNIDEDTKETSENPEDINEIAQLRSKKILEEAELEKKELLSNAEKEATMIIEEAYEDSKTICENAKTQGYNEGFQIGKQEGYQEFQQLLQEAAEIKKQMFLDKKRLAKELEKDIVNLVMFCIEKVIDYELDNNHEVLLNLIKKGLKKCTFTETLVIRVSDQDYETLSTYKNKIYMMTEGIDDMQIKSDAALLKGSVVIETLSGKIDASIDTQINQIEGLFKELLKSEGFHEGDHA